MPRNAAKLRKNLPRLATASKVVAMKGTIALAGFMLTADEWEGLDPLARAELVAAASPTNEAWVVAPLGPLAEGSGRQRQLRTEE